LLRIVLPTVVSDTLSYLFLKISKNPRFLIELNHTIPSSLEGLEVECGELNSKAG
jgi:hypothetical protein